MTSNPPQLTLSHPGTSVRITQTAKREKPLKRIRYWSAEEGGGPIPAGEESFSGIRKAKATLNRWGTQSSGERP